MKQIVIPPKKILEREVRIPRYAAHPEFHLFPPIAVLEVPDQHPYKEKYCIDYLCLDGHKRLASAHVRKEECIQARVPECKNDLCLLFVAGGMNTAARVFSKFEYEEITQTFLNPLAIAKSLASGKNLRNYLLDEYGYAPRIVELPETQLMV